MASKLVLVTGASSGIGEAAAKRYGAAGAHVLLLARNAERLFGVAHAIREAGGTATAYPIDLTAAGVLAELAGRIQSEIGTPDILINNAGVGRWLPLVDTTPEDARAAIEVPYLAAFNLTRAFAQAMIARGSGGIVFVSSPASYVAWPNASAYIASRRAVTGLAEALQSELKRSGVCITLVILGSVTGTGYWEHNPGSRESFPEPPPFVPNLSLEDAAKAIMDGPERKRPFVVKPAIYRALFVMNALFPNFVASQLRRAAKKARQNER
ncbi:MAG: SDR family NAD(P)-dependent oxidoreductase [Methyloceanibacter sp.]